MRNKKAVSTVIATVLIIMLTIAAAAILVAFLKPFVENNLKKSSECIPFQDYVAFEDSIDNGTGNYNYNCWQNKGSYYLNGFTIKTGNIDDTQASRVQGFTVVLTNSTTSETITLKQNAQSSKFWEYGNVPGSYLDINSPRDTRTYIYKSDGIYDRADVYLLLDSRSCEIADSIPMKQCVGGVTLQ